MRLVIRSEPNKEKNLTVGAFSLVVALLPVLASYASGIPGFSVADVALALFLVLAVIGGFEKRNNTFAVKPVLIYVAMYLILFFALVSMVIQSNPQFGNVVIRVIRYFFYLVVVQVCATKMLDIEYCKKLIKLVSIWGTIYILLQYVLYHGIGYVLKGFLPFLKLYVEDYATKDYNSLYAMSFFRPTSFFLEPAHYARYAVVGLALYLFDGEELSLKEILCGIFICVGILISTSAQGYLLMALVWITAFAVRIKNIRSANLRNLALFVLLLMPVLIALILRIPFVNQAVMRILTADITNENTALGARLGGIKYYLELPLVYKLIGMGFGVIPDEGWISSAVYWLYGSGIIVFTLYLVYGCIALKRTKGAARMILLIFLILFFSDDSFYSYTCVLYISISLLQPPQKQPVGVVI